MSNFDRYETPYHKYHFPDPQEKVVVEYSTCSGCGETITETEVFDGEILDVYGMAVHDEFDCLKKAVEAKTIHI